MSFVTILPEPIIEPLPIFTPDNITEFDPIQTSSSIIIDPLLVIEFGFFNFNMFSQIS